MSSTGLFSAGSTSGGPFTISATSGTIAGNASVIVTSSGADLVHDRLQPHRVADLGRRARGNKLGLDWTDVVTASGFAFGTQAGGGGFDDSYAYLAASYPRISRRRPSSTSKQGSPRRTPKSRSCCAGPTARTTRPGTSATSPSTDSTQRSSSGRARSAPESRSSSSSPRATRSPVACTTAMSFKPT